MEVSGGARTGRQRCLGEIETLLPVKVLFLHHSSVQDSIYALGKGHMRSTLSVSCPDITVLVHCPQNTKLAVCEKIP